MGVAERLAAQLAAMRRAGDIAVASIHWGPNWGYAIPAAHRQFARALIDLAGVSIVHGHSSHHPMAIEVYDGRLIIYGCGDFLTDYEGIGGYEAFRPELAVMYLADIDAGTGRLAALAMAPLHLRKFRLNTPSDEDVDWLCARLDAQCRRFGAGVRREGSGLALAFLVQSPRRTESAP